MAQNYSVAELKQMSPEQQASIASANTGRSVAELENLALLTGVDMAQIAYNPSHWNSVAENRAAAAKSVADEYKRYIDYGTFAPESAPKSWYGYDAQGKFVGDQGGPSARSDTSYAEYAASTGQSISPYSNAGGFVPKPSAFSSSGLTWMEYQRRNGGGTVGGGTVGGGTVGGGTVGGGTVGGGTVGGGTVGGGTVGGGSTVDFGGAGQGTGGVVYGPDGTAYSSAAAAIAAGVTNFTYTKPVVPQTSAGPGLIQGADSLTSIPPTATGNANPGGLIAGANQQLFNLGPPKVALPSGVRNPFNI